MHLRSGTEYTNLHFHLNEQPREVPDDTLFTFSRFLLLLTSTCFFCYNTGLMDFQTYLMCTTVLVSITVLYFFKPIIKFMFNLIFTVLIILLIGGLLVGLYYVCHLSSSYIIDTLIHHLRNNGCILFSSPYQVYCNTEVDFLEKYLFYYKY